MRSFFRTDGILASLIRAGVANDTPDKKWYVFDGPVDAVWIENMNTVLDDNKKLCLSSGEIIKLTEVKKKKIIIATFSLHPFPSPSSCTQSPLLSFSLQAMTMMFEVQDLAVASPATVSRCGMVYLEPSILGLSPFIRCWLKHLPKPIEPFKDRLEELFFRFTEPSINFVRKNLKEIVPSTNGNLTFSLLKMMDCFFAPFVPKEVERERERERERES